MKFLAPGVRPANRTRRSFPRRSAPASRSVRLRPYSGWRRTPSRPGLPVRRSIPRMTAATPGPRPPSVRRETRPAGDERWRDASATRWRRPTESAEQRVSRSDSRWQTFAAHVERRRAVDAAEELQVLAHAQVFVQRKLLRHVADDLLDLPTFADDVEARNPACAARRRKDSGEHADRRGFAGPVRSKKTEDLAFAHTKGDVDRPRRSHRIGGSGSRLQPTSLP